VAKVTITIEDTASGGAEVSWTSDTGLIHSAGTQAEEIAILVLKLLAKAGDVDLPLVKTDGVEN